MDVDDEVELCKVDENGVNILAAALLHDIPEDTAVQ